VLLSGDHKKIAEWREREGLRLTDERARKDE
jgi:tRNA G37 N-methylase TrmD